MAQTKHSGKALNLHAQELRPGVDGLRLGEKARGSWSQDISCPPLNDGDTIHVLGDVPRVRIVQASGDISDHWIARVTVGGRYQRGIVGLVTWPDCAPGLPSLLAMGWFGYGAAGRIGARTDCLLSVPQKTLLRIRNPGKATFEPVQYQWLGSGVEDVSMWTPNDVHMLAHPEAQRQLVALESRSYRDSHRAYLRQWCREHCRVPNGFVSPGYL